MHRFVFGLCLFLATPLWAEPSGQELFLSRCAGCHGIDAEGDGAMAALISVQVPDLTRLAVRNDGLFPLVDVVRIIDGRLALLGHGGAPMPVFGTILGGGSAVLDTPDGGVLQTRGDVLSIAHYLESLQIE